MSLVRKLNGFAHSSHRLIIADDGALVFDLYFFGDDNYSEYVRTLHVEGDAVSRAREDMELWAKRPLPDDRALADAIESRFDSVLGAQEWMDELRLPYKEVLDPFVTGDPGWQTVKMMHGAQ